MAGDWIKVETALPQKPEVIRMGRRLGLSPESICGWLVRFWGWYGANSVDGVVDGVELCDVDMIMSLPGFGEALEQVGWLKFDVDGKRLSMPNFERHNGESSKKRALRAGRQARYREGLVDGRVDTNVDTSASTKEPPEKRREEKVKALSETDGSALKILGHLNAICGTRYKPLEATLKLIRARLAEHGEDVLLRVIEGKAGEWKGTEQAKYLRPETLFGATKCAGYAGQVDTVSVPPGPRW